MNANRSIPRRPRGLLMGAAGMVLCLLATLVQADVLVTASGDSLSGDLVRITEGTLVFRTSLRGQMMLPMDRVESLGTDRNLAITQAGGAVLYGRLATRGGRPHVLPIDGGMPQPLVLAEVTEAMVIPSAAGGGDNLDAWRASLSVGGEVRRAADEHLEPTLRLSVGRESEDAVLRTDLQGGERLVRARAEAWGSDGGLAPHGLLRLEHDRQRGLDLRAELSLGVLKPLLDSDDSVLNLVAGLGLSRRDWERPSGDAGLDERRIARQEDFHVRLSLDFQQALAEDWRLSGNLELLPSLSNWGQYQARSEAALSYTLTPQLRLRLDLLLDFDSDPGAGGVRRLDTAVGASLQMDF